LPRSKSKEPQNTFVSIR